MKLARGVTRSRSPRQSLSTPKLQPCRCGSCETRKLHTFRGNLRVSCAPGLKLFQDAGTGFRIARSSSTQDESEAQGKSARLKLFANPSIFELRVTICRFVRLVFEIFLRHSHVHSTSQGIAMFHRIHESAQGSHHPAAEGAVRSFELGRLGCTTPFRGGRAACFAFCTPRICRDSTIIRANQDDTRSSTSSCR